MNWKEIQKECPKSIGKLLEWRGYKPSSKLQLFEFSSFLDGRRLLYDFFDEQGIKTYVTWTINKWFVWIGSDYQLPTGFETRKEAETKAFTKAFETLELKL